MSVGANMRSSKIEHLTCRMQHNSVLIFFSTAIIFVVFSLFDSMFVTKW